jgi:hypothetical protein
MKYVIPLNEGQSSRILEQAARTHSQVLIELPGGSLDSISGQIVSCDESVVLVATTRAMDDDSAPSPGRCADVQLFSDQRYFFSTHIVDHGSDAEPRRLVLERPPTINVLQRRRFLRTRLAPSSDVQLSGVGGEGPIDCAGTLLNLSGEGLACRTTPDGAAQLSIGQSVQVRFEVPEGPAPFELAGTVCNLTPASGPGPIIGIQFMSDQSDTSDLRTLRDWLYRRQSLLTATGAAT